MYQKVELKSFYKNKLQINACNIYTNKRYLGYHLCCLYLINNVYINKIQECFRLGIFLYIIICNLQILFNNVQLYFIIYI